MAAGIKPGGPRDQANTIYGELRDLIVSGRLAPGSRIVEQEVAARFKVSRTPVRSALTRLQREGYVVSSPRLRHARPQVAPLTKRDAEEVLALLGALEGQAARAAAALPPQQRQSLVRGLRLLNRRLQSISLGPEANARSLGAADAAFHAAITQAAAGPRLQALLAVLRPQADRYARLYNLLLVARIKQSVAEHKAIIRAIENGREDAAQHAVERNHRNSAARLAAVILDAGELGSGW